MRPIFYALVLALLLALGAPSVATPQGHAADPDLEFEMEVVGGTPAGGGGCITVGSTPTQKGDAVCSFPAGSSFTLAVELTDPGPLSGQVATWIGAVSWTSGLTGPELLESKGLGFRAGHECLGLQTLVRNPFGQDETAMAICTASSPPWSDAEATSMIAEFEMNCGPTPSQELVTMRVGTGSEAPDRPIDNTAITDSSLTPFVDKDGSEVITIICAPVQVEFNMEITSGGTEGACTTEGPVAPTAKGAATCRVPVNGTFEAEVRLDDPGPDASGQGAFWLAVVAWTTGLTGPGDPSSTKQSSLFCPGGLEVTTGLPNFPPQTFGRGCGAFPPPFSDQDLTSIRATFEFTCGATDSQELLRLHVVDSPFPAEQASGTHLDDGSSIHTDADGTEVITILCGDQPSPPPPTPAPTVTPPSVGGLAELPDAAGAPAQGEIGGGAGLLMVLFTAAGVAALAGAGWYARRRWGG